MKKVQKKNSVSYILLLFALMVVMFAAVVVAHSLKGLDSDILGNSPTITPITPTPSLEDETQTPQTTTDPDVTQTPTPVPTPTPTPTPIPIIEEIDESKLVGLDTTVRSWSWAYPYKEVEKHGGVYRKTNDGKVLYLTFDNGYENGFTPRILDILKEKNVKAIFFVTGSYIRKNQELVKRMVEEGHLVGNHTNTHPEKTPMPELSVEKFVEELVVVEREYEKIFGKGQRMFYYRPPGGVFSIRDLHIAAQMHYETIFWDLAHKDYGDPVGVEEVINRVIGPIQEGKFVGNGAVILLHSTFEDNANALATIIDTLREMGYEFRRIDE